MTKHLVHELPVVTDSKGVPYTAAVMGSLSEDGLWEGYIELHGEDGTTLTTPLETRQPNLADLVYWSTGLSRVYLQGALARARAALREARANEEPSGRALERGLRLPRTRRATTTRSGATPRPKRGRPAAAPSRPR